MNKNYLISKIQFCVLMFFPILTTFNCISFNNIIKIAGVDSYLSVVYSFAIGLIFMGLFIYIFNFKPFLSLPDKNIYLFGKLFGNIINYLIIFIISIVGMVIIYSTSSFIMVHYLKETPRIVILLVIGFIVFFTTSKGIEVIVRSSFIFFIIIIILTGCSIAGLITKFDINNIKPFLEYGLKKPMIAGNNIFLNSILPVFVLLIIPKNHINNNKNISKYLLVSYFLIMFLVFLMTFLTVGILGIYLLKLTSHPEYVILKKLSIFHFIDRIENIVYMKWIFISFTSIVLIIYYISNSIKAEDKALIKPFLITTIILLFPLILFKTNINFNYFIINNYHYFNLMFLGIFVLISINIFIRKVLKKET